MKFYTWVDVQDRLSEYFDMSENHAWLAGISMSVYWDGLRVKHALPKEEKEVMDKLKEIFLERIADTSGEQLSIVLENGESLPIFIEAAEAEDIRKIGVQASLARPPFIALRQDSNLDISARAPNTPPRILAFHSFKGGVGRTLHAIAFAMELSAKGKVLLIDADFEAPGITWMVDEDTISFSDFLTLLHGADDRDLAIEATASALKDATQDNIIVMPAFRDIAKRFPVLQVKPEHIYNFDSNTFVLTDAVAQLGELLSVDYIVLDLRAGLSELSTSWLLDPRVTKFFVTTLSSQSMQGTAMSFKLLHRFSKLNLPESIELNEPVLIFSQIDQSIKDILSKNWSSSNGNEDPLQHQQELKRAYIAAFLVQDEKDIPQTFQEGGYTLENYHQRQLEERTIFSIEYETLKSLPRSWEEVLTRIKQSGLLEALRQLMPILVTKETNMETRKTPIKEDRESLHEYADKLVFAERNEIDDFLPTDAILKLINKFKHDTPIAVIVGVKGSGKTFLYKQIVQNESWEAFMAKVSRSNGTKANRHVFPVTIPLNMTASSVFEIHGDAASLAVTGEKRPASICSNHIIPYIVKQVQNDGLTVSGWRKVWINCIAWALGVQVGEEQAGEQLPTVLKEKGHTVIALFDGLEDIFKNYHASPSEQKALEALLQYVPQWLESLPHKPLGVVIFIRKDIVGHAIKQNESQFLDRYKDFELIWDEVSAMRLVHWTAYKAEVLPSVTPDIMNAPKELLQEALYPLWGERMSKNNSSREAFTHRWVLGALANFNQHIQSRDIVRFLKEASKLSAEEGDATDRILTPTAIRKSVVLVGSEKIKEIKQENLLLKPIFEKLEALAKETQDPLKFPCIPKTLADKKIELAEVSTLEKNGILTNYQNEYYMPEIYRQGFGFLSAKRGKPKTLYMY